GENFVVAKTADEAVKKFAEKNIQVKANEIKQDEDVLDTWFSSWLWPISVFDGFKDPKNKDISYYYPTNDLVTAPEILFFWVARMIIAGCEYRNEKPFERVYLTGIVRDKLGRKMSKSLGNSPDPLELISKFGADGVRVGMLLDIETVPQEQSFEKLDAKSRELWLNKSKFINKTPSDEDHLYNRAGIYAEFGKIVCISTGYFTVTGKEKQLHIK